MYLLRRQIIFQTYGRWSGWNDEWMIFKSLMICIYLDDKLSSKLMEDDQDEMDDI